jgi:hypothetical protein
VVVVAGRAGVLSKTHPVRPNRLTDRRSSNWYFTVRCPLD